MNEIMLTSDNLMPIETQNKILSIEKQLAELKKAEDLLKSALLEEMTKRNETLRRLRRNALRLLMLMKAQERLSTVRDLRKSIKLCMISTQESLPRKPT